MANQISKEEVQHVAELAKLEFNATDLDKFTKQFEDTIDLVNTLNEVDTEGVEPTFSVTDQVDRMREDVAVQANQKDALLKNAPDEEDGFIRVPAIIDESEEA
ncbi:Asp-tRNA(Asn)/Glu-tRNA(Gln) amidotransferase subunit GatC [Pediococcus claussenii]|uniref:Aspartyl/glutamyl-tRNA(Asn/Gln) amidotransferase subunit C n=1 Tax=Pediococcus claussenii (strain ATCC BAA-344 / DSM 14800 / JCM 18046 / KCTC 3811 / LMG 21948 / P06) TaxID=701521 RepID=G8PE13_PEDCP|nr:Asp-tRNA(Asn)/Glu-tRNA(Gln) amidotransferase subunit GatC [Pediococcus claussenii]AEV95498.1 aspartyl/glutamyl-tRNA(Asn/Gln) amidotransferase, C subunit [Pediococcus claussenii ATCC BAA-344]ANZ69022.1 asparaginyl/glutamyl-tRNA amidotransferase subunit C [Pediococcus claussenii]ANZ70838.1 asparaginyl/glutamyl-tRNA amidotransferase subunit C [Pediococcus claussenii]